MQAVRKIIHIDMDAFYASVEQRDEPSYRGRPLAVGGSPENRGVVCAASYEARKFGIHSAMPSRTAVLKCPNLVFVRPRFDVYKQVSEQIHDIFHRYTDLVEPLALDEAYLDVTVNKKGLPSATLIAKEIKDTILAETQLTASAGVSINKFLLNTSSGINKPNGLCLIPPEKAETFAEQLSIDQFHGIGPKTAERMRSFGVRTGADLKRWSEQDLYRRFGKVGLYYYNIVRGIDERDVEPNRVRKSVGAEESFAHDLEDQVAMRAALVDIAETVARRMTNANAKGRTLTLKVKYADYTQVTRSRTSVEPIEQVDEMVEIAMELMDTTQVYERNARLLGLSMSNLDTDEEESEFVQLTLSFT